MRYLGQYHPVELFVSQGDDLIPPRHFVHDEFDPRVIKGESCQGITLKGGKCCRDKTNREFAPHGTGLSRCLQRFFAVVEDTAGVAEKYVPGRCQLESGSTQRMNRALPNSRSSSRISRLMAG